MEKARILFQNEDGSKEIAVNITDLGEGSGMEVEVDFGTEGSSGHEKGLYAGLANYLISQFHG